MQQYVLQSLSSKWHCVMVDYLYHSQSEYLQCHTMLTHYTRFQWFERAFREPGFWNWRRSPQIIVYLPTPHPTGLYPHFLTLLGQSNDKVCKFIPGTHLIIRQPPSLFKARGVFDQNASTVCEHDQILHSEDLRGVLQILTIRPTCIIAIKSS